MRALHLLAYQARRIAYTTSHYLTGINFNRKG